jgi:subtilisin family serine protease
MQIDPALKYLVLRKTGSTSLDLARADTPADSVPVVARLRDPSSEVAGLHVVARFGAVVTGRLPLDAIAAVRADPGIVSLKASRGFGVSEHAAAPEDEIVAVTRGVGGAGGKGVVVGVIDWGCDFAHANFRRPDGGTRLLCLWDQRRGPHESSPPAFGYGRLFDRTAIDAALMTADPYAALGYDPFEIDPAGIGTHGTHVLDIAAGNGSAPGSVPGTAPEADLLFVHLKGQDTLDTDTMGDSVSLLEAMRFAIDAAGSGPVVLNMSMGRHGGPHDGSTPVEQAIDEILTESPGRAIVMSTGNYFDARVHSAWRVTQGETADLTWLVRPRNDETAELEVWYSGRDRLAFELIDPHGGHIGPLLLGEDLVVGAEPVLVSAYHRAHDPNNGDHHLAVFVWPEAPIGRWTVRMTGETVEDGRVDAWIERDDATSQSRFPAEQAVRQITTNTICNGHLPIVVGAYGFGQDDVALLPFSSSGPTRDGRAKPDLIAPGGSIRAARSSRIVEGVRTRDELTVKSGTSMAAPHVTGAVALMFEAAGPNRLAIDETRGLLLSAARPLAVGDMADALRSGAGQLDVTAAVEAVRRRNEPSDAIALVVDPADTFESLEQEPESGTTEGDVAAVEIWRALADCLSTLPPDAALEFVSEQRAAGAG